MGYPGRMSTADDRRPWAGALARTTGARIARLRGEQRISQDELCKRCSDLGYAMKRPSLAALELGERATLAVHEVIVIATALDVAPIDLLFPPNQMTRYLPHDEIACFEAVERFTGRPAEPTTWADTLRRLLTDREGHALLNVVNAIQARARG